MIFYAKSVCFAYVKQLVTDYVCPMKMRQVKCNMIYYYLFAIMS